MKRPLFDAQRATLFRPPQHNPRPAAWDQYPPGTEYPCAPSEGRWIGRDVPGRAGGTVAGCATPQTKSGPRARQGQFVLERRGRRTNKRKRTVYNAIRRHSQQLAPGVPLADLTARAEAARERPGYPFPIGVQYPHPVGSSKCADDHPVWKGYNKARKEADQAAQEYADAVPFATPEDVEQIREAELRKARGFQRWKDTTRDCLNGFDYVQANRKPRATESSTRAAARARAEMLAAGIDPTSAEYLDTLAPSSRARALRRAGRVQEARDLEAEIRATKGARKTRPYRAAAKTGRSR